jgi:hypothetical protein
MEPHDPLAFDFDTAIMSRGMLAEREQTQQVTRSMARHDPTIDTIPVTNAEDLDPNIVIRK